MTRQTVFQEQPKKRTVPQKQVDNSNPSSIPPITHFHPSNRALQRLLTQRSSDGAFDLDDATSSRINRARGGGQLLDTAIQQQMSQSLGHDFSGVRVHTGSEAHALNEQLNAKAFTTGSDLFFRDSAYSPQSSSGQQLLAHELTHVVQQSTGAVGGGGSTMTVNAPGDRFEQEADRVAQTVTSVAAPPVQRQMPEEEEVQAKRLQRQAAPDEEELAQMQELDEDDQVQMQAMSPDDEIALAE